MKEKIIIYQLLPRLFGNVKTSQVFNGTIEQNGCGKFNDLTEKVIKSLGDFGITHIWLTGVIRHATQTGYPDAGLSAAHPDIVKGMAGSPYAITDYYDVDPDLAVNPENRMAEFENAVRSIHDAGLKVIIDFVPNHVAREYRSLNLPAHQSDLGAKDDKNHSFSAGNNFYYLPGQPFSIRNFHSRCEIPYQENPARATGNDVFRPDPDVNDWYETVKLNYGVDYLTNTAHFHPIPDTWIKMTEILLFWSSKGIDGFRCDMAGMVPADFWHYAISQVKAEFPGMIFIAELYEPGKYREYLDFGFFDYLYDKVGLYDTLRNIIEGRSSARSISAIWQSLEGQDNAMLRFLENHDEQRIASRFFAGDPWKAIPGMAVSLLLNQGPALIYSGQEVGEAALGAQGFSGDDGRTSIFDYSAMPELQKWYNHGACDGAMLSPDQQSLREAYGSLLQIARKYPVFANGQLYDLMWVNLDNPHADKLFAFLRYGGTDVEEVFLVVTCFDSRIPGSLIKIPGHALETIGFDAHQQITIQTTEPYLGSPEIRLVSQIISIGIPVTFNKAGYCVLTLS